jgi:shikimate kinase
MLGEQNVYLIGYRGTGKTTVARALAERLGCDWIDTDDEVERRAGKTIAEVFADDGEAAFRDLESQVVDSLCRPSSAGSGPQGERQRVVALGGGAVLRESNRASIEQSGVVVWLRASVDTIAQRVAADETTASRRPNLTRVGGRSEIEAVLAAREPIYRECATFEVNTDGQTTQQVVDEISRLLSSHDGNK